MPKIREQEIREVEEAIATEKKLGKVEEETKHVRVRYGIYSQRNETGRYVVRIRVPSGIISADALDFVAALVEKYSRAGFAHFTTRQGIQIATVPGEEVGNMLREIEGQGLSTRRTGGNVVRNVVSCVYSGVAPEGIFDVTPYALAVDDSLRDDPEFQSMPRKMKISFESCPQDHVRTVVSDIGLQAVMNSGAQGFKIFVGGGLGAVPIPAQLLEPFTPSEILLPTLKAILRVFNEHGNRANRSQARLKWLIRSRGIEWFRENVFASRSKYPNDHLDPKPLAETPATGLLSETIPAEASLYQEWVRGNTRKQQDKKYSTVIVPCHLGDLQPAQIRGVAEAARKFSVGSARISVEQNLTLRSVPEQWLPNLYSFLVQESLGRCCGEQVMDVTRCVGSEACISAITNSLGASRAIVSLLANGFKKEESLRPIRIRVSGCQNSCSHHPMADIGLQGVAKKHHEKMVPHYSIRFGNQPGDELSQRLIDVPACNLQEAIRRILQSFLREKEVQENFRQYAARKGMVSFQLMLKDLTEVPKAEEAPQFYKDLEGERDFRLEAKEGECHA